MLLQVEVELSREQYQNVRVSCGFYIRRTENKETGNKLRYLEILKEVGRKGNKQLNTCQHKY